MEPQGLLRIAMSRPRSSSPSRRMPARNPIVIRVFRAFSICGRTCGPTPKQGPLSAHLATLLSQGGTTGIDTPKSTCPKSPTNVLYAKPPLYAKMLWCDIFEWMVSKTLVWPRWRSERYNWARMEMDICLLLRNRPTMSRNGKTVGTPVKDNRQPLLLRPAWRFH